MISRRLAAGGLVGAALTATPLAAAAPKSILVHEHILVDFAGADIASPSRYDREQVVRAARPRLDALVKLGCRRLLECTPNFLGRDPLLLDRLSQLCGIELWTNTGLYAANQYRHLPRYALEESAFQLSRRWVKEWKEGLDGTRPKFIKIGINGGKLGQLDRKIVEAACYASLETRLPVASHTGPGAMLEQLEIVSRLRLPLKRFIWVHAQNEKDHAIHRQVAESGAWVEFDGINARTAAWHRECVAFMAESKLLGRTLISQDSGWYRVGEPDGGRYNGYEYLYTDFLPTLNPKWIEKLLWENPREAFGK